MDIFLTILACKNCMVCECLIKTSQDLLDRRVLRRVKLVPFESLLYLSGNKSSDICSEVLSRMYFSFPEQRRTFRSHHLLALIVLLSSAKSTLNTTNSRPIWKRAQIIKMLVVLFLCYFQICTLHCVLRNQ
jgi:hypothetical protein